MDNVMHDLIINMIPYSIQKHFSLIWDKLERNGPKLQA